MLGEGEQYKVVRLLDELLPEAVKPVDSGVRLDCRIYFREKPNGDLWGEVIFVNPETGKAVNREPQRSLPLQGEGVMSWYFGEIADRGFELARRLRRKPRGA